MEGKGGVIRSEEELRLYALGRLRAMLDSEEEEVVLRAIEISLKYLGSGLGEEVVDELRGGEGA